MTPTPTKPSAHIGPRIAKIRLAQGLAQADLAKKLGISPAWMCEIESGHGRPSIDVLCTIAKTLRVPLTDLVTP